MSSSPFFPKVKGAEKEEEDRLCKELTSQTVCIENLLHLVPFPQALLKNKLIELELAVFKLTGPSTDSLKAQLKQKLAYYWEVYAEAPFSVLHSKKTSSSLERVPPSTSSSSCFLAVNSSGTVEANVMTPVPAVNNQFSSSSLLAILPPPLPLSPPPTSLDLTSILENFCPLMENKKSDVSEGTFICINAHSSGEGAVRLPVQEMKSLKDPKEYQKFQPQVYVPPANDYVTLDGDNNSSSRTPLSKSTFKENHHSPRGYVLTSKTKFGISQKKSNSFANAAKSNSSSPFQQNLKYCLKPMPDQITPTGPPSTLKKWDILAISDTASMAEVRNHIERIYSLSKPIVNLNYLEPFKALTILAAKTVRLILNHEHDDGFEELKTKVFELIASKLPAAAMEQYEKLYEKQSLRSFLGFLCNFIQDKIPNSSNSHAALCFKCFQRGHWLDRCRGEPMFSTSFFDFENNNGLESDAEEEEGEEDDDDDEDEKEEEDDDNDEEDDDEDDDEEEKRYYQPLSSVLPARSTLAKPALISSEQVNTAELKVDANGFYTFN